MGDSSRIEVFKSSRTEDPGEEASMDKSLVCSVPHTVLWISSSLLPRNCADRMVVTESTYSSQNSEESHEHQETGLETELNTSCSAHPRGPSRRQATHNTY